MNSVKFVTSVQDFQNIFTTDVDGLVLCYENPSDAVDAESLGAFKQAVLSCIETNKLKVILYIWDCSSSAFAAAKKQLEKVQGELLMLVVYKKEIADMLRGPSLASLQADDVPRVCKRFAGFQQGRAKVASVTSNTTGSTQPTTTVRVDVAKMVGMGKKLMSEGQAFYAEKFFQKTIDSLDAVKEDIHLLTSDQEKEDYLGSLAMCLAWNGLAQLVQGKGPQDIASLKRLRETPEFETYVAEPLSDANRVVSTQRLMLAAPRSWTGESCSKKKLTELLKENPEDFDSRSMLVITLFMCGELDLALTEAVKLYTLKKDYGRVALKQMIAFLGEDHPLVVQLGPLKPE